MKHNPVRYSSAVGEAWLHISFKVKYCHRIFDNKEVREECYRLFEEASERYGVRIQEIGFDSDHAHLIGDLGLKSKPELAKCLKGYTAKKLLERFPELKKSYFWGSGLWNPSYYMDGAKSLENLVRYVRKQKYGGEVEQHSLKEFITN